DDEGERGREGGEAEHLVGEQREHRALLADHAADEGIHRNEQYELRQVFTQTEPDGRSRRVAHERSSTVSVAFAQSSGPPLSTCTSPTWRASSRLAAVIARSPCPHITVNGPRGSTAFGIVAS